MGTTTMIAAATLLIFASATSAPAVYAQTSPGATKAAPKAGPTTWDKISGNWTVAKGKAKQQWGKLTDDDLTVIEGRRDVLVGRLQERYGYSKKSADRHVTRWERSYKG